MNPYLMTIPALEQLLYVLYSTDTLTEHMRYRRADFARAYHDRTGRYFAARFY